MEESEAEPSYIDYETFISPTFSPTSIANTLVHATNNASDTLLDLNTPLSRVLFDVQDIDTRIDSLTSKSALPLLNHTKDDVQAGGRILQELETQLSTLTESYERLHKDVILRHEAAQEARVAAERLWRTLKLGRSVGRCLTLGRQLEAQLGGWQDPGTAGAKREDYGAMVRSANTILALRQIFNTAIPGGESEGLDRITVVRTLRSEMVDPAEEKSIARAEQVVGQFSMSALTAASQSTGDGSTTSTNQTNPVARPGAEDTRSRATSALLTLYLLSPIPKPPSSITIEHQSAFAPLRLINALQEYLRRAITSSLSGLTSALATLPRLDRTLLEVSARCQNIVALEMLLESLHPPEHPLVSPPASTTKVTAQTPNQEAIGRRLTAPPNLLTPLLHSLDTSSLPSYFWRSMASQLSARVQRILKDGGVSARTLRSNRDRVRDALRECVNRGSQLPASSLSQGRVAVVRNWEREAAVMVGSVLNVIGR